LSNYQGHRLRVHGKASTALAVLADAFGLARVVLPSVSFEDYPAADFAALYEAYHRPQVGFEDLGS
jgi:hypothetical protein